MRPLITVLTAVRNGSRYLPETVASIRGQTFEDWEYILVDDASWDETPALIERYVREDPRFRFLRRTQPGGPCLAALEGLKQASGKYIVRTDADDVSLPHRIRRQLSFLRDNPGLRACASLAQHIDERGMLLPKVCYAPSTSGGLKWILAMRCPLIHSTAMVEKQALVECYTAASVLRLYDRHLQEAERNPHSVMPDVEDYRMWCALAGRGWLGVLPDVLVYYRKHSGSVSAARAEQQKVLARNVMREHLQALSGATFGERELEDLYAVGHESILPIPVGLAALHRWDALWRADASLTAEDRQELRELSAVRHRRFLRANAKRQPFTFLRHVCDLAFAWPRNG